MERYQFANHLCVYEKDPTEWTRHVNDQAIVVGWAGYDIKTRWLAPEHFLAHCFREALSSFGPDGKLLVQICEDADAWHLERVLFTIQQPQGASFLGFCASILRTVESAWDEVRSLDDRWKTPWNEVETLVNPNGPLEGGGSDFDNGQTGRKLVMDYYGPRIPLGGGALSGKHLTHIDRLAAYSARLAAVRAVAAGAKECLVQTCWAPNIGHPLEVSWQVDGHGQQQPDDWFDFDRMSARFSTSLVNQALGRGEHFSNLNLPWNQSETSMT
jgi:S-adenosylmethionine synthetase